MRDTRQELLLRMWQVHEHVCCQLHLDSTSDPIICFGLLPCETCPKRSVRANVFRPLITVTHTPYTGKNNGFSFLDIFGYLKNTHKNPKFGRVRQVPIWELGCEFPGWEFPGWDLSHFAKCGIFMGKIPKNIQKWESVIFSCDRGPAGGRGGVEGPMSPV